MLELFATVPVYEKEKQSQDETWTGSWDSSTQSLEVHFNNILSVMNSDGERAVLDFRPDSLYTNRIIIFFEYGEINQFFAFSLRAIDLHIHATHINVHAPINEYLIISSSSHD